MYIFQGSKDDLIDQIKQFPSLFTGDSDKLGIGAAFRTVLGYTLLSDIYDAFVTKSKGGTDAMGIKWPPLSPKTIANRRVGRGDTKSDPNIAKRKKIVEREFKKNFRKFLLSMPEDEARTAAKRRANAIATQQTGKTKVQTLGQRKVEMLRDRGLLANSLIPGTLVGGGINSTYNPPTIEGGEDQIFDVEDGYIVIGTDRPYAAVHQRGNQRIPRRQFLPDEETGIPLEWVQGLEEVAESFMIDAIEFLVSMQKGN